jgi:hypothetical protein
MKSQLPISSGRPNIDKFGGGGKLKKKKKKKLGEAKKK